MSTILKNLKFVPAPKRNDPVMGKRLNLIRKLDEQKLIAADPGYVRRTTRFKGKGEARRQVEVIQRVSPWFKEQSDGSMVLTIKAGMSALEIEKGKSAVLIPSKDKLVEIIDFLIAAVREGEFDAAFQAIAEAKTAKKTAKQSAEKSWTQPAAKSKSKAPAAA
jgi:hypothetical protein